MNAKSIVIGDSFRSRVTGKLYKVVATKGLFHIPNSLPHNNLVIQDVYNENAYRKVTRIKLVNQIDQGELEYMGHTLGKNVEITTLIEPGTEMFWICYSYAMKALLKSLNQK